ncbi:MAG: FkbM family methyltransferase [Cyanobacteria bacterium P01_A01_bin.116]
MSRQTRKLKRFRKALEGNDFYLCVLDEFLKRERIRKVHVGGTDVYVRTCTPDLDVAISSLIEKEYDHIRSTSPKVIIDAGANIGTSAIFFAEKYPDAKIIAIEPEDSNFELLLKNTSRYENVVAIKAAVWGAVDKRNIQNRFTGHWGYTVSDTNNETEALGQEIDCITISSIMEKYGFESIDLLKMDIEGGEKNVLESATDWVDLVKVMTVELHDRICMGCSRAFYLSTQNFQTFEKHGEKVTAYR